MSEYGAWHSMPTSHLTKCRLFIMRYFHFYDKTKTEYQHKMNNLNCAKFLNMEKDDPFHDLEKNTLIVRIIFFLYICYREVSRVQSRWLFKVRFEFLVTCLSGEVRLLHRVRRSWWSSGHGKPTRHCVHTSQWSVFRQVVDESKSERSS